ncbi:hypothetical protein AgCh_006031 [Apium graveolens]
MWQESKTDVESGTSEPLYPMMLEAPELRWAFIRKIYSIVAVQLILTAVVSAFVVSYRPVSTFLTTTNAGLCVYILIILTPFVGKVILEAVILTAVVVVSLTLYTFWAVRRGQDFNFLGPFLFASLIALILFGFIQIFFPLGGIAEMIYGCLASVIFCGYIVYDTDNIIKRNTYDEYIWASVSLYLDIIDLFLALLKIFKLVNRE